MTNKQITIDGIDVSGCEKHGETIAGITCGNGERIRLANEIITKHKLCKDNPNCVYKQLKRKEQECKVLALDARVADNHLQHRIEMCDLLREKLKAKEQECDKLKFNLKGAGILDLMKRNVQLKKALDDIEINISEYQGLTLGKPRTMRENDCIYNILNIIDKVKELK